MDRIEDLICNNRISNSYLTCILRSRFRVWCGRRGINYCVSQKTRFRWSFAPKTPKSKEAKRSAAVSRQRPGNTKTAVVIAVVGFEPDAEGGARLPPNVEPRTAPENATTAISSFPGIRIRRRASRARSPAQRKALARTNKPSRRLLCLSSFGAFSRNRTPQTFSSPPFPRQNKLTAPNTCLGCLRFRFLSDVVH